MEPVSPVFKAGHPNEKTLGSGDTCAMPLPVYRLKSAVVNGTPQPGAFVSKWRLTARELEQVAKTGEVYLLVIGQHPPVQLSVDAHLADNGVDVVYDVEDILERLSYL
jgi:hypothetical protein